MRMLAQPFVMYLGLFTVVGGASIATATEGNSRHHGPSTLAPPLSFEANLGQANQAIKYMARGPGYSVFLSPTETTLVVHAPLSPPSQDLAPPLSVPAPPTFHQIQLQFRFIGPKVQPSTPQGRHPLSGKSHYFIGNDASQWHTDVPHYAQVLYEDLYPGIDVLYYGHHDKLEYDLIVAPGADPQHIRLEIQGADHLSLLPDGGLQIQTAVGDLTHHRPVIYQDYEGVQTPIEGTYHIHPPNQVSFTIAEYDRTRPLFIDPVLSYGSYIPSNGVNGLVYAEYRDTNNEKQEAIYLAGAALPFYVKEDNALDHPPQGYLDLFVSKYDATGTGLIYTAYLGGEWDDQGRDLAVDDAGHAYVVGISSSRNFPLLNPLEFNNPLEPENSGSENSGSYDVVIAKLSPQGSFLKYASYLGGCGEDGFFGNLAIAVGEDLLDTREEDAPPLRTVYLAGSTNSPDFPIVDPFQPAYGRLLDTFVTKLRAEETDVDETETPRLIYSTFLGGTGSDTAGDIAIDDEGQAYIVGTTSSTDFPTHNAFQDEIGVFIENNTLIFSSDIFVTKIQPDGLGLVYSTYLGGDRADEGYGLALNRFEQVFITGSTRSNDFPKTAERTPARRQRDADVIVSQVSALGTSVIHSARIGGIANETGLAIALERDRDVWVTGRTASTGFPTTLGAPQRLLGQLRVSDDPDVDLGEQRLNTVDAFVFHLRANSETPSFSTYLGGNGQDEGRAIVTRILEIPPGPATLRSTIVAGRTFSTNFPRTAARHPLPSGGFLVDFLESDVPEEPEDRFPCPIFCFPIPLPTPPFLTPNFPPITADLKITMTDIPDPVIVGEPLEYTITVTNIGSHSASNIRVTDILPPWFQLTSTAQNTGTCQPDLQNQALVCFLGNLGPNGQTTFTISGIPLAASHRVPNTDPEEEDDIDTMPNRASVFNAHPDSDYTNNTAAVFTEVIDPNADTFNSPLADLTVMKNDVFLRFDFEQNEQEIVMPDDPDPITNATLGRPYLYEITVTNAEEVAILVTKRDDNGELIRDKDRNPIQETQVVPTSAAADVILTDLLPSSLTPGFVSIDPPQGACQGLPDFRCFLGNLEPGAEVTVTIWVMPSAPDDTVNGVLVTTRTTEPPGRTRNTDTEETAIQIPQAIEAADLRVTFTDEEELVLTEEDERDENDDPPDPVDSDQHTGRGEVTWKLEVLNSGPDKALNVVATSRLRVMDIDGIAPTTLTHLDSIPPSSEDLRARGIRHFQPLKGERLTADNFKTLCPTGKDEEGEPCEIDGRFECTFCEEFSPLCALCQGKSCTNVVQAFSTEEELDDNGEPSGEILVTFDQVEPEDIIPETILEELKAFDDNQADHQEEIILSCNIGTLESEEKFLLDFSVDLTQGIHGSSAQATSLTFDPDPSSNESAATTTVAVPAGHPTRGGIGGSDGTGSGCFIATAAYGSALGPEIDVLRQFRDRFLLPSPTGQLLVNGYYATSPPLAAFISEHPLLKGLIRGLLWPIVWWTQFTLQSPAWGITVVFLTLLLTMIALFKMLQLRTSSHRTNQVGRLKMFLIITGIMGIGLYIVDINLSESKTLLDDTHMDAVDSKGETQEISPSPSSSAVKLPPLSDAELEALVGSGATALSPFDNPFQSLTPMPLQDYFNATETQNNPTSRTPFIPKPE